MKYKVHTIDLKFLGQTNAIAAFVIEYDGVVILVESGPHSTLPILSAAVEDLGYTLTDVKAVLLSHIHLDHAGAAWCFAEQGAHVYVHPFGYPHILDPTKLLASATMIYGSAMDMLWGTLKPIASDRISAVEDRAVIDHNGLKFTAHHTPGHAKHHIAWELDNMLFTGDVGGVCINKGPVIPPCPPPDINIEDWITSIDRIQSLTHIDTYYLTHYGEVDARSDHMEQLRNGLQSYANFVKPYALNGSSVEDCLPHFMKFVDNSLKKAGLSESDITAYQAANPADMSVTGLMRYWLKKMRS